MNVKKKIIIAFLATTMIANQARSMEASINNLLKNSSRSNHLELLRNTAVIFIVMETVFNQLQTYLQMLSKYEKNQNMLDEISTQIDETVTKKFDTFCAYLTNKNLIVRTYKPLFNTDNPLDTNESIVIDEKINKLILNPNPTIKKLAKYFKIYKQGHEIRLDILNQKYISKKYILIFFVFVNEIICKAEVTDKALSLIYYAQETLNRIKDYTPKAETVKEFCSKYLEERISFECFYNKIRNSITNIINNLSEKGKHKNRILYEKFTFNISDLRIAFPEKKFINNRFDLPSKLEPINFLKETPLSTPNTKQPKISSKTWVPKKKAKKNPKRVRERRRKYRRKPINKRRNSQHATTVVEAKKTEKSVSKPKKLTPKQRAEEINKTCANAVSDGSYVVAVDDYTISITYKNNRNIIIDKIMNLADLSGTSLSLGCRFHKRVRDIKKEFLAKSYEQLDYNTAKHVAPEILAYLRRFAIKGSFQDRSERTITTYCFFSEKLMPDGRRITGVQVLGFLPRNNPNNDLVCYHNFFEELDLNNFKNSELSCDLLLTDLMKKKLTEIANKIHSPR